MSKWPNYQNLHHLKIHYDDTPWRTKWPYGGAMIDLEFYIHFYNLNTHQYTAKKHNKWIYTKYRITKWINDITHSKINEISVFQFWAIQKGLILAMWLGRHFIQYCSLGGVLPYGTLDSEFQLKTNMFRVIFDVFTCFEYIFISWYYSYVRLNRWSWLKCKMKCCCLSPSMRLVHTSASRWRYDEIGDLWRKKNLLTVPPVEWDKPRRVYCKS